MNTNITIPEPFESLFYPLPPEGEIDYRTEEEKRSYFFKIYYGGRSGCKSHSIARALLINGTQKTIRILCVREYFNSIADSVKALLDDLIEKYDLDDFYKSIKNTIVGKNGTTFIFGGLKINNKNIKGKEKLNIVWVEEAESVSQESWDLLIPTVARTTDAEIWISFNPYTQDDPVMKLLNTGRPDIYTKKVTYRDNPFFSDKEEIEMSYCKDHDYDKYLWVWEGNPLSITEATIFKGKYKTDSFEAPKDTIFYLGLDFGFSVDKLAFIRCYIDQEKRKLFIDKAGSALHLEIDDTPAFLESVIPDCKDWMITADSARPEIISYLKKRGFKVRKSIKGKDSIVEGIEYIRNYTTIIHESLKGVIHEFNTYSYKVDKQSGDITPLIEDKNNHYCFAAGTKIDTINGKVSIEDIQVGNKVLTRGGYKEVTDSQYTGIKEVKTYKIDNNYLTMTPDHKVITNKGKVSIKDLTTKHTLFIKEDIQCQRRLDLMELPIGDIQTQRTGLTEFIIHAPVSISNKDIDIYTEININTIKVLYQKVSTFTTKTRTHLIMILKTLSVLNQASTNRIILKSIILKTKNKLSDIWRRLDHSQKNGMGVKRVYDGIKNTAKRYLEVDHTLLKHAKSVIQNTRPEIHGLNFAVINVEQGTEDPQVLIMKQDFVLNAERNSQLINTVEPNVVPTNVPVNTGGIKEEVYNITVKGNHEYFANNILVSNCDALRYSTEKLRRGINKITMLPPYTGA